MHSVEIRGAQWTTKLYVYNNSPYNGIQYKRSNNRDVRILMIHANL